MTNKLKITFEPGCFDNFNGTQEELDAMIADVVRMFETGDFTGAKVVYLGENDLDDEDTNSLQNDTKQSSLRKLH